MALPRRRITKFTKNIGRFVEAYNAADNLRCDDLSGVGPLSMSMSRRHKPTNNHLTQILLPTPQFTFRVQMSPSVFNSLQTALCHRTTSGLHPQAHTGLHSRQSRQIEDIHVHKARLLPTRSTLRSCRSTPGSRSRPRFPCPAVPSN